MGRRGTGGGTTEEMVQKPQGGCRKVVWSGICRQIFAVGRCAVASECRYGYKITRCHAIWKTGNFHELDPVSLPQIHQIMDRHVRL